MKTLHLGIIVILVTLTLYVPLLASPTSVHAMCITVNGTQRCGESPPVLDSIKTDKLIYTNSDKPVITIIGIPYAKTYLEINDPSGNIVFSQGIDVLPTGVANYTLDVSSYKPGVYSATVTALVSKFTTTFAVGLSHTGGSIRLNSVKTTYSPGDDIIMLGVSHPNEMVRLSLTDPNGIIVQSTQTISDKTGRFSSFDFKIPQDAISGIWWIGATSGVNHVKSEIKVNYSISTSMMKNNTEVPKYCCGSTVTIQLESPLKQFKHGGSAKDVTCWQGFQLIFKSNNGFPECVKPDTAKSLLKRGWAKLELIKSNENAKSVNPLGVTALVTYTPLNSCLGMSCPPYTFYLKINSNSAAYLRGYDICGTDLCVKNNTLSILLPIANIQVPNYTTIGLSANNKWQYGDTVDVKLEISSQDNQTEYLLNIKNSTIVP